MSTIGRVYCKHVLYRLQEFLNKTALPKEITRIFPLKGSQAFVGITWLKRKWSGGENLKLTRGALLTKCRNKIAYGLRVVVFTSIQVLNAAPTEGNGVYPLVPCNPE